jgi:hypothetical protein
VESAAREVRWVIEGFNLLFESGATRSNCAHTGETRARPGRLREVRAAA